MNGYTISMETYEEMIIDFHGLCIACNELHESCDSDTDGETCEVCGKPTVMGPMTLLFMGLVQ